MATAFVALVVAAGAEERLSETQFGFRSGRSTLDAIFVFRRRVDLAGAQRDGKVFCYGA